MIKNLITMQQQVHTGMAFTDFTGDLFDHKNLDFLHGGQIEVSHYGSNSNWCNSSYWYTNVGERV